MDQPSFYAIIPADVRYNKKLPANAKLLYGEITALCSKEGYCWAGNKYFMELYDVSKQSISSWLSCLEEEGFINIEISQKDGNTRKIYITPSERKLSYLGKKTFLPRKENFPTTIINTNINTTNRSSTSSQPPIEKELIYEEQEKQKYKTKKDIYNQLGINYKPAVRTTKQEKTIQALLAVDYFRERVFEEYRLSYLTSPKDRNGKIRSLAMAEFERTGSLSKLKEVVDFYLGGYGEWCNYEPDNCFTRKTTEAYLNKDIKPKQKPVETYEVKTK